VEASEALSKFIRWVMRDVTYLGTYPATVMGQAGEMCDVRPDDPKVGGPSGLSGIPIRHGIPGVSIMVPPGSRVLLAFENGDPSKPYVALWEKGTVLTLVFADGTMPLARVGDQVMVQVVDPISGPLTGTGQIVAGNPKLLG
jgi:hypothetical protein